MDELDLFRSFNRGAAHPSAEAQRRASSLLARAMESETAQGDGVRWSRRRFGGQVVAVRLVLVAATVAVAAAVALFLTAPWSSSPSFDLARAEAALTPPDGMILHQKWVTTVTSSNPKCTVRFGGEVWLDAYSERTDTQRYRGVIRNAFLPLKDSRPPSGLCPRGSDYGVGGTVDGRLIVFVPPNRLVRMPMDFPPLVGGRAAKAHLDGKGRASNPVEIFRHALRYEGARDDGQTRRDGRTVERIRFGSGIAYVDPDTFYPIEIDFEDPILAGVNVQRLHVEKLPLIVRQAIESHLGGVQVVVRFPVYEYLPRTGANVALTSIRAQHPNATGP